MKRSAIPVPATAASHARIQPPLQYPIQSSLPLQPQIQPQLPIQPQSQPQSQPPIQLPAQPQQELRLFHEEPPAQAPDGSGLGAPPRDAPFLYRDYVLARTSLEAAVRRGPFYGLLTGASGTGKTAIAHDLMARLDRHRHNMIYISSSLASVVGIARFLSQSLLVSPRRSHLETVQTLSDAMRASPAHIILWLDEADQVPLAALAELRVIAECAIGVPQLFSVVFCGLPALRGVLDVQALFPLKRRISVRCALEGLRREELEPYLVHRFGAGDARRISAGAHDELFERSLGTPGLLLRVVGHALECSGAAAPVTDQDLRRAFDAVGL